MTLYDLLLVLRGSYRQLPNLYTGVDFPLGEIYHTLGHPILGKVCMADVLIALVQAQDNTGLFQLTLNAWQSSAVALLARWDRGYC